MGIDIRMEWADEIEPDACTGEPRCEASADRRRVMLTLLTKAEANPKASKCVAHGWLPTFHHLAPADLSGRDVCSHRSAGCTAACLHTAGNPQWQSGKDRARIERTRLLFADRTAYVDRLIAELREHVVRAKRRGLRPCARLNATSDLRWESIAPRIFAELPEVRFYDYTKVPNRVGSSKLPENYYLCFSRSELTSNHRECARVLESGGNVVAVIADRGISRFKELHPMPRRHDGYRVTDGDKHDLRFKDSPGWTFLRAKGLARSDRTGFAINLTDWRNSK